MRMVSKWWSRENVGWEKWQWPSKKLWKLAEGLRWRYFFILSSSHRSGGWFSFDELEAACNGSNLVLKVFFRRSAWAWCRGRRRWAPPAARRNPRSARSTASLESSQWPFGWWISSSRWGRRSRWRLIWKGVSKDWMNGKLAGAILA